LWSAPSSRVGRILFCPHLSADATFHELLLAYDCDFADTARCADCARCSGVVHSAPCWRKPRGRPCRSAIACGHKDAIDLDRLRHDPLMKLAVGRCPSGAPLASQSTFHPEWNYTITPRPSKS